MLYIILIIIGILWLLGAGVRRIFFRKGGHMILPVAEDPQWYMRIAFSREDFAAQMFIALAVVFAGVTALSANQSLGEPVSWRMILLGTAVLAIAAAYWKKSPYALVLGVLGILAWWPSQAYEWVKDQSVQVSGAFFGTFLLFSLAYIAARIQEADRRYMRFSIAYSLVGLIAITGTILTFSTRNGLRTVQGWLPGAPFAGAWQILVSVIVFVIAWAAALVFAAGKKRILQGEVIALAILALLVGVFSFLPQGAFFNEGSMYAYSSAALSTAGLAWAIIFNFVGFALLSGIIFLGYKRQEDWLVNLGAVVMFLFIIFKYFDWFFSYIDKGFFFLALGPVFILAGWFMERSRRMMISSLKKHTAPHTN